MTSIRTSLKNRIFILLGVVSMLAILLSITTTQVFAANLKMPKADGTKVLSNSKASIDASNLSEGYIMVKYTGDKFQKVKLIIEKQGGIAYTYNLLTNKAYETFPLSQGKGTYKVTIYENISDTKYSVAYGTSVTTDMSNDYLPFLYPNQYANYKADSKVIKLSEEITKDCKTELEKVQKVYNYVVDNYKYDYAKAKNVESGYIPVVDSVLESKTGICFDYAAVMVSMLRGQEIPTKLIVGYAGKVYHAWINVYIKDVGWVDNVIYFDGKEWKLMDPTFASTSKSSSFKPDEKKYTARFAY